MSLLKVARDQPSFRTVGDMIQHEIDTDVGSIRFRNVFSNNIEGSKENPLRWKTWHDFAQRAAVVMRLHMLEATDMLQICRQTGAAPQQHLKEMEDFGGRFDVTADADEATEIARQFDQIFLPELLEKCFHTMKVFHTMTYVPVDGPILYVIDFPNSQGYEIYAHLTVTLMDESEQGLVVAARPFVSVIKIPFQLNQDGNHPNYDMLRDVEFLNKDVTRLNVGAEGGD